MFTALLAIKRVYVHLITVMLQKRLETMRKELILRDGYMPNFQMERLRTAEKAYMKLPGSECVTI